MPGSAAPEWPRGWAAGFDGRIVVAGAEQHGPYERPALSKRVLLGECPVSAIGLRPDAYWREHAIELRTGETVDSIDVGARRATTGGHQLRWGRLALATGVRARRIPELEGLTNVHYLRTADDAANLRDALLGAGRLAVIGAGFVGLEAASAALKLGVDVTVVDPAPVPFQKSLGAAVGLADGKDRERRGRRPPAGDIDRTPALCERAARLRLELQDFLVSTTTQCWLASDPCPTAGSPKARWPSRPTGGSSR